MRQLKISQSITNRDAQSLTRYFADINKVGLITHSEEILLTQKIKNGDKAALEDLTIANLRFVVSVAKQYQNRGLMLEDLINEGNVGLIAAAKRFDESKGFKFISYAVWWIRHAILLALAGQSRLVRLPSPQINSLNRINKAANILEQQLQRMPTEHEIAETLNTNVKKVTNSLRSICYEVSIYSPISNGEGKTLLDVLSNSDEDDMDRALIATSMTHEIKMVLSTLVEIERQVLMYYFGLGTTHTHSIEEISEKLNINEKRVRRIKERALMRLRLNSKVKLLKHYL